MPIFRRAAAPTLSDSRSVADTALASDAARRAAASDPAYQATMLTYEPMGITKMHSIKKCWSYVSIAYVLILLPYVARAGDGKYDPPTATTEERMWPVFWEHRFDPALSSLVLDESPAKSSAREPVEYAVHCKLGDTTVAEGTLEPIAYYRKSLPNDPNFPLPVLAAGSGYLTGSTGERELITYRLIEYNVEGAVTVQLIGIELAFDEDEAITASLQRIQRAPSKATFVTCERPSSPEDVESTFRSCRSSAKWILTGKLAICVIAVGGGVVACVLGCAGATGPLAPACVWACLTGVGGAGAACVWDAVDDYNDEVEKCDQDRAACLCQYFLMNCEDHDVGFSLYYEITGLCNDEEFVTANLTVTNEFTSRTMLPRELFRAMGHSLAGPEKWPPGSRWRVETSPVHDRSGRFIRGTPQTYSGEFFGHDVTVVVDAARAVVRASTANMCDGPTYRLSGSVQLEKPFNGPVKVIFEGRDSPGGSVTHGGEITMQPGVTNYYFDNVPGGIFYSVTAMLEGGKQSCDPVTGEMPDGDTTAPPISCRCPASETASQSEDKAASTDPCDAEPAEHPRFCLLCSRECTIFQWAQPGLQVSNRIEVFCEAWSCIPLICPNRALGSSGEPTIDDYLGIGPHIRTRSFPAINEPAGPTFDDDFDIQIDADDPRGISRVEVFLDGHSIREYLMGGDPVVTVTDTISIDGLAVGPHRLIMSAEVQGVIALPSVTQLDFIVDRDASAPEPCAADHANPSAQLTAPIASTLSPGIVTMRATASDDVGVQRVVFYVDSQQIGADTTAPFEMDWTAIGGDHTLSAVAVDICGKSSAAATRNVHITTPCDADTTVDSVALLAPANGGAFSGGGGCPLEMSASASDAGGIAEVRFLVNGVVWDVDPIAPYTASYPTPRAETITVVAEAVDNCGRTRRSSPATVHIQSGGIPCNCDHTPPTVSVVAPAFIPRAGTNLVADATDNLGVDGVAFQIDGVVPTDGVVLSPPFTYHFAPTAAHQIVRAYAFDFCGQGAWSTELSLNAANTPPVAFNDTAWTLVDSQVEIPVVNNDSDADGDHLIIGVYEPIPVAPTYGTATRASDTTVLYTPAAGFQGTDTFRYRIADGWGGLHSAVVTVTVRANQAPIALADSASTRRGVSVNINVTANDSDPDGHAITLAFYTPILEASSHGTAERVSDSTIRYTPAAGFTGTDTFRYRIADGHGGLNSAIVTVTVTP